MAFPTRGQQAPDFWDDDLQGYIDAGDNARIPKGDITSIVKMTQSEYDALDPKVATTLYVVVPD